MAETRKVVTRLLILSILCFSLLFFYAIWSRFSPDLAKLEFQLKVAFWGLVMGIPYYFLAMVFFLTGRNPLKGKEQGMIIAGQLFRPDLSIANPANHIIASSLVIFISLSAMLFR